ncbi:MAG TPA: hypothetical protein ENK57_19235, partial [Polyangiaceae bacterium]|nr:hypothetical protein [Polyangiaceae bacterium]
IQEGKVMSELSSRSSAVVQARDIGKLARPDGDWIPYMVLEWLDGTPLDAVLKSERRKKLPPRDLGEVLRLLEQAAKALELAHRSGIAHRDFKPANIMVMGDARADEVHVKILDFGIAKVMAHHEQLQKQLEQTGHHITAFTPNHGAPEQFSRSFGATGPWTDVYAMALIMVEVMRGGEPALEGETFYELGVSSCEPDRRPTPRFFELEVTDEVEAIFQKALALQPTDRFESMGAFWKALHHAVFPGADTWRSGATQRSHPDPGRAFGGSTTHAGVAHTSVPPRPSSRTGLVLSGAALVVATAGAAYAVSRGGPVPPTAGQAALEGIGAVAVTVASSVAPAGAAAVAWDGPCPASMTLVPGGTFTMGSDDEGFALWKPAHEVSLDTYCLDVHEVTVADYARCVAEGGCTPAHDKVEYPKPDSLTEDEHQRQLAAFSELCNAGQSGRDDHPINCVDAHQAEAYCAHLGQRLPTEAEWEFAARGDDGRTFPWGDDTGDETYMNAGGTEWRAWLAAHDLAEPAGLMFDGDDGFAGTAPVGRYPRAQTQRGHMDMVGNVWEWTSDWYALYPEEPQSNPKGPAAGERKAIRGGGFNGEFALWMNPAARYHQLATASVHAIGFRCASNVKAAE